MQYALAFQYIVKRVDGYMNLLLITVCTIIPIVGPVVLLGYQAEVADRLIRDPELRRHPLFTFDRFMEYLTRGVWPFLVQLLVGFAVAIPMWVVGFAGVFVAVQMQDRLAVLVVVVAMLVTVPLMVVAATLLVWPWTLHAELTRGFDVGGAWRFTKSFWSLLGAKAFGSLIVFWLMGAAAAMLGMLLCFVGIYPANAVIQMAAQHLMVQHYLLYLERGGEPLTDYNPYAEEPSDDEQPGERYD